MALAGKELSEFFRTWRGWVLGGFLLFFALASPVLAKLTPQIIGSMSDSMQGIKIEVPEATWTDSYAQWIKNLSQLGILIVVVIGAGMVAGEEAAGTAVLVLTKPVSRSAFVLVKALFLSVIVALLSAAGTAIVQAETALLFGQAPGWPLWSASLVWAGGAAWTVCLMALLSVCLPTLAAAGLGILAIVLLPLANLWPRLRDWLFTGFLSAPSRLVLSERPALLVPGVETAALALLLLALAAALFRRKEL